MRLTLALALTAAAVNGSLLGCGGEPPSPAAAPPTSESLEDLMRELRDAAVRGDAEHVRTVSLSMVPTVTELRSVLKPGPDTDAFVEKFPAVKERLPAAKDDRPVEGPIPMSDDFKKRTEIHVYAATTEDLARYEKGTVAFEQFPGGMQRFAQKVAAPGRTWYCVTFVEPGQRLGTKFTSLTRVGGRFLIVAKPWRAIPRDPAAPDAAAMGGDDGK